MAEAKAKEKKEKKVEVPREQFMNTNDWPLYRDKELFRVKDIDESGEKVYLVSDDESKDVQIISQEELLEKYEPVKGLHKREF